MATAANEVYRHFLENLSNLPFWMDSIYDILSSQATTTSHFRCVGEVASPLFYFFLLVDWRTSSRESDHHIQLQSYP